jgi:hypothetical protein
MKDPIVAEVREIRREIETENKGDWEQLEGYFKNKQERHKKRIYKGKPKPLPVRNVVNL